MTSWLIGSSLSDCPSEQVRAIVVCCKPWPLSPDQWLLNDQDPTLALYGSSPMATGGPIWGGGDPSAEVQSVYSTDPANRAGWLGSLYCQNNMITNKNSFYLLSVCMRSYFSERYQFYFWAAHCQPNEDHENLKLSKLRQKFPILKKFSGHQEIFKKHF